MTDSVMVLARLTAALAGHALERGAQFLLERQGADGLWRDFLTPAGEASEWPTGFIGTALVLAGADQDAVLRATEALVANQHADGGWGYNENVPCDADSTACVLRFLALMGHAGNSCERAVRFLCAHQRTEDGGIATYRESGPIRRFMGVGPWMRFHGWCSPHTEVTATAGRALATVSPSDRRAEVNAAWRFVRSRQCSDGSWSSYWWTSPHYTVLQAVELALLLGEHAPVDRAAAWAIRTQQDDGGWSTPAIATSAFATALCLCILVNAGAEQRPLERAVERLVALQDADGGWPSHPIMRIPLPGDADPNRRRRWPFSKLGRGIVVSDQHRTFTSAACLTALTHVRHAAREPHESFD